MPGRDADEFTWIVFEQSGVLTRGQAFALLGRAAVRHHLRQGRWRTLCPGLLLTSNAELNHAQRLWAATLLAGPGARLGGLSAVIEGGVTFSRSRDATVHVLVPGDRRPSSRVTRMPADMPPVRVHRTTVLPAAHCQTGRPPRTTMARSVIDAASWAGSDREAQLIVLTSCQQGRVLAEELHDALRLLPRCRRHRLIGTTIRDVEGGAGALSEIDFLALCRRFRIPAPERQKRRKDDSGRVRFIDAYWPAARLQVEIDGAYHAEVRQWGADAIRQNAIWISGERVLRFPAWIIRENPHLVATQLKAALSKPP
jgi:hypothetical protein